MPAPDPTPDLNSSERAILQQRLDRSPFNAWLGLRLVAGGPQHAELTLAWQEAFISTPERRSVHGGVLASLVDAGAIFALICTTRLLHTTVDLRVDYHAVAAPGPLRVVGRVIRVGRTLSTSEAEIFDVSGRLAASGRGTFMTLDVSAMSVPA